VNERHRIECSAPADRDALVTILARNGYTVRHYKEKRGKTNNYTHYIEYWKETNA